MRPTRNGAIQAMTRRSRCTSWPTDGPLHLDDDVLPGEQRRPVDLCDRRRGERLRAEVPEDRLQRLAEVLFDDGAHGGEGLGRHLVPAALELRDELGREDALARRQDLPELDVRRAEALGGEPQPPREIRHRFAAAATASADRPHADGAARAARWCARTRMPGGTLPGRTRAGRSAATWRRNAGTACRHRMASGSTTHGASVVKLPRTRSAGGSSFDGLIARGVSRPRPAASASGHGYGAADGDRAAGGGARGRAGRVGGGAGRRWPARRVGSRRREGRASGRRPDATPVEPHRRARAARGATVRPGQPGQAVRGPRPPPAE